MNNERGFFSELFDLSFKGFITPRLIKFLYGLSIFIAGVIGLIVLISGIGMLNYSSLGLLIILSSPIVFLLGVIYARVFLELTLILFRIEEHLGKGDRTV